MWRSCAPLGFDGDADADLRGARAALPAPAAVEEVPSGRDGGRTPLPAAARPSTTSTGSTVRHGRAARPSTGRRRPSRSAVETIGYDQLALVHRVRAAPPARCHRRRSGRRSCRADARGCGRHGARTCAQGRRVLVVGGGYIGLEAAAVAAERASRSRWSRWPTASCSASRRPVTSDYFRALHLAHGVEIREGHRPRPAARAQGRVTGARAVGWSRDRGRRGDRRASASRRPPHWPRRRASPSRTASASTTHGPHQRPRDLGRGRLRVASLPRRAHPARKRAERHRPGRSRGARTCWARTWPTSRSRGSGRTSTTSSSRSPGSTSATTTSSSATGRGRA